MSVRDWRGQLPESKSIRIRDAVIASHRGMPAAAAAGAADDVRTAIDGLASLCRAEPARGLTGAAPLRFLALRASRIEGDHRIEGDPSLFARPIAPLVAVLERLGVEARPRTDALDIRVRGPWRIERPVDVDTNDSSQFASAVCLNAWALPSPCGIRLRGERVSTPYWRMTLARCRAAGMAITEADDGVVVAADQRPTGTLPGVEPDASAAFALAAVAAMSGPARIDAMPADSAQSDARFPGLLRAMGVPVAIDGDGLVVEPADRLEPIDADLGEAPDLFCVLAALCAFANGASRLVGAPHLRVKESDRIARTAELLRGLGRVVTERDDGLVIAGNPGVDTIRPFTFDPAPDHRLAMAAAVVRAAGAPITIDNPDVVAKSFPRFFDVIATT